MGNSFLSNLSRLFPSVLRLYICASALLLSVSHVDLSAKCIKVYEAQEFRLFEAHLKFLRMLGINVFGGWGFKILV